MNSLLQGKKLTENNSQFIMWWENDIHSETGLAAVKIKQEL